MNLLSERYRDLSDLVPLPTIPDEQVDLHPGQVFFTKTRTMVTTILGPSVSLFLFDDAVGIAGVNHFVLPASSGEASSRFGDVANELLLQHFIDHDIPLNAIKAKVFGGAAIHPVQRELAARNVETALDFLRRMKIRLISSNVGGNRSRKLHFCTSEGVAWIRLLSAQQVDPGIGRQLAG